MRVEGQLTDPGSVRVVDWNLPSTGVILGFGKLTRMAVDERVLSITKHLSLRYSSAVDRRSGAEEAMR